QAGAAWRVARLAWRRVGAWNVRRSSRRRPAEVAGPSPRGAAKTADLGQHQAGATLVVKHLAEVTMSVFDLVAHGIFALRAVRSVLAPKLPRPEMRVPDVSLDQVAGIGSAKAEALEIVECLMAPARFMGLGAICPKGLLLTGPPGCGKTLLARAIAATAAVPFISRSGADFNQRYAGAGSSLVKELFQVAALLRRAQ
ncbi:unnamed protein product, partial [Prorocentrum cordatum]